MEIKVKLSTVEHKDLLSYCNLNDLLISEVVKKSFTTGFNIERYGLLNTGGIEEKQVVKEVIVEKRVEIPVEVIKEIVQVEYVDVPVEKIVEVVKEVPVEKIVEVIKEVPVEKIVIQEKIVEVIKEVPVEIIKEIIKEVPVEKVVIQEVIKEVPVEKVVTKTEYISDNTQVNELLSKIQQLEDMPPRVVEVIKEVPVDRVVIQEKIIETIKEVPVEVIKEIIKEVEVPVEVVKEIIIEKESDGNWKPKLDALQNTVHKLKQDNIEKDKKIREYEQTIQDIQKFQEDKKAVYLSGSNLNKTL
jgi:hypothetical protein